MTSAASPEKSMRPRRWRRLVQFNLRTLLGVITIAAVASWFYAQPRVHEEHIGASGLLIRAQVRLVDPDPNAPPANGGKQTDRPIWFISLNVGRWQLFDSRGNRLVEGRYRNDKQHGRWTTYHVNGRKAAEGQMAQGNKVGCWRFWDDDGRLISEVDYRPSLAAAK